MEKEYAIKLLEDYVKIDRGTRNHEVKSDYDNFCELHCRAIETLLKEVKEGNKC